MFDIIAARLGYTTWVEFRFEDLDYYPIKKNNLFIYLFILGCIGSSLLRVGFL